MSRYRGPKLRITRRLGSLPGLTQKQSKKHGTTRTTWKEVTDGQIKNRRSMEYD